MSHVGVLSRTVLVSAALAATGLICTECRCPAPPNPPRAVPPVAATQELYRYLDERPERGRHAGAGAPFRCNAHPWRFTHLRR